MQCNIINRRQPFDYFDVNTRSFEANEDGDHSIVRFQFNSISSLITPQLGKSLVQSDPCAYPIVSFVLFLLLL